MIASLYKYDPSATFQKAIINSTIHMYGNYPYVFNDVFVNAIILLIPFLFLIQEKLLKPDKVAQT